MCLYVFFGMILWVSPCSTPHFSPVTRNMEVLEKLKTLREERGWKVGLSLSGVGQTKTLEKALKTGLLARIGSWWVAIICFFFQAATVRKSTVMKEDWGCSHDVWSCVFSYCNVQVAAPVMILLIFSHLYLVIPVLLWKKHCTSYRGGEDLFSWISILLCFCRFIYWPGEF